MLLARLFALCCVIVLAGCAAMLSRPLPPKVQVDSVAVSAGTDGEMRLRIRLDVQNPNAYGIAVRAIEAEIRVEDEAVAHALLPSPVLLAASGATKVEVEARPDLQALGRVMPRVLRRLTVQYEVVGYAVIEDRSPVEFRRRGELPLLDLIGRTR